MSKRNALILVILIFLFASCNTNSVLDYEIISLEYQTPDCEPERDACLMVKLRYPQFIQGDSVAIYLANRIIRNSTLDFMGMGDVEAAVTPELETAVKGLDESLNDLKNEFGANSGWMAEMNTTEIYRNDSILVLETSSMGYFGGAHGNYNTRYFNFNRKTGRLIPLNDFVDLDKFKVTAEEVFRSKYMKEGQTYAEAGFSFLGESYILPANYAFKGDSVLLHYNHYEIAPYAAGVFDLAVSLK